ncbi:MAG TPA: hypothetical protein VF676_02815 [Flavobacterium sp.]
MEKNFRFIKKSPVRPLYIEKCEELHGNILYRRRYHGLYVLFHKSTNCYYMIEHVSAESFSYERLVEFVVDNHRALNTHLN